MALQKATSKAPGQDWAAGCRFLPPLASWRGNKATPNMALQKAASKAPDPEQVEGGGAAAFFSLRLAGGERKQLPVCIWGLGSDIVGILEHCSKVISLPGSVTTPPPILPAAMISRPSNATEN